MVRRDSYDEYANKICKARLVDYISADSGQYAIFTLDGYDTGENRVETRDVPIVQAHVGSDFRGQSLPEKGCRILIAFDDNGDPYILGGIYNDAIARPFTDPQKIGYMNGSKELSFDPSSEELKLQLKKIQIESGVYEIMALVEELMNDLIGAKVVTMLGSSPFTADTIAKLTTLKTKFNTFKV